MSVQTNITMFCFLSKYSKNVAKILADKLEMFYVDFDELFEFDLVDSEHILKTLGKRAGTKYMAGIEQKTIRKVNEFENTIITISPQKLFSDKVTAAFKESSFFAYLQMTPSAAEMRAEISGDNVDSALLGIGFSERDKLYVATSDVVVNCSKLKEKRATKKLIKELKSYFKKRSKIASKQTEQKAIVGVSVKETVPANKSYKRPTKPSPANSEKVTTDKTKSLPAKASIEVKPIATPKAKASTTKSVKLRAEADGAEGIGTKSTRTVKISVTTNAESTVQTGFTSKTAKKSDKQTVNAHEKETITKLPSAPKKLTTDVKKATPKIAGVETKPKAVKVTKAKEQND